MMIALLLSLTRYVFVIMLQISMKISSRIISWLCVGLLLTLFADVNGRMNSSKSKATKWCPPANFVTLRKKTHASLKVAVISEIHGQLVQTGMNWGIYYPPNLLARWCYHHLVVMGIDKLYLNVLYNDTIYPIPPTPNDIYPEHRSCVVDWFKTDLLHWRTIPYASKNISTWPIDVRNKKPRVPSLYKDLYKSLKSINPTYAAIHKMYDWILVHDVDEYLLPLNWNTSKPTAWCKPKEPTMVSVALQSMMETAQKRILYNYNRMNQSRHLVLNATQQCPYGHSVQNIWTKGDVCRPIAAFILPERIWMNAKGSDKVLDLPSLKGRYYSIQPENSIVDGLTQAQEWKSFHYVAHAPTLEGTTTYHYNNPQKSGAASVLSPRDYHKEGVSLEIAHVKPKCTDIDCERLLLPDSQLIRLNNVAATCSQS